MGWDFHNITGFQIIVDLFGLLLGADFKILLSESSSPDVCLGLFWAFPGHSLVSHLAYALCFHLCLLPQHNLSTPGQPDLGNASLLWVYLPGLRVGKPVLGPSLAV